jgi:hypothetical protein
MARLNVKSVLPLLLGVASCQAFGATVQVSLGQIGVFTGVGAAPNNNLVFVSNNTNNDCTTASTFAYVCGAMNITNWSVTIQYTALIGGIQVAQTPITEDYTSGASTAAGYNPSITPGNDFITNPIDGSLPYSVTNACCDTLITEVDFTGTVPGSFTICDPNAGCIDPSGEVPFFLPSDPWTFTFSYIPGQNYLDFGSDSTDLLVSADNGGGGGGGGGAVPEPATTSLLFAGVLVFAARKHFAR